MENLVRVGGGSKNADMKCIGLREAAMAVKSNADKRREASVFGELKEIEAKLERALTSFAAVQGRRPRFELLEPYIPAEISAAITSFRGPDLTKPWNEQKSFSNWLDGRRHEGSSFAQAVVRFLHSKRGNAMLSTVAEDLKSRDIALPKVKLKASLLELSHVRQLRYINASDWPN